MRLEDDDFTLLGLRQRFALERAVLDDRWRALQAQVHPDRFAAEGAAAQRVAMQWAMRVNQAHQRLKDPLRRAAYLCELRGAPVDAERNTAMPAAFLQQQMAWREALDEAADEPALRALDAEVELAETRLVEEVAALLDETQPEGVMAAARGAASAAERVRALMFMQKVRADLARRLETFES